MATRILAVVTVCLAALAGRSAEDVGAQPNANHDVSRQISRLLRQLDDDRSAERDAAEKEPIRLAGSSADESDRFLEALPKESDDMPLAVRERISRIRQVVEERAAKAAVEATAVTLSAKDLPIAEVFAAIEKQTGNRIVDNRRQGDDDNSVGPRITIELKDEPFWPAVDQVLDQAGLGVYTYGGEDALSVVQRDPSDGPRYGRAAYSGPFRMEVLEIQGQRNLRQPDRKSLKLQLEVSWEPRLRPIALSQPVADLSAETDANQELSVSQPDAMLDVEVQGGTQAAEIILPSELPPRDAESITTLRGKLRALVPGRQVKFRFDNLAEAAGKTERRGGVHVTIDDVRKNNAIWEVHMRLGLDEANNALESHRGWVFQNVSVLEGKDGQTIDNAGFETTRQTGNEVGVAYFFDLPEGIDGLTWLYETPAAIVELPLEFELKNIELP